MRRSLAITMVFLLVACGDDPVLTPSVPTIISRVGSEVGTPGWLLGEGLSVVVRDDRGEPVEGETVEWSSAEDQSWLGAASSVTDADGVASVAFAPGWRVGDQKVRATTGTLQQDVTVEVSTLDVVQVAFSRDGYACGIDGAGAVWCWSGRSIPDRFDEPTSVPPEARPIAVDPQQRYSEVFATGQDAAAQHCGITLSGALRCWQFTAAAGPAPLATEIVTPAPLVGVAGGVSGFPNDPGALCGLDAQGQAWCRGSNTRGELGDGTTASRDEFAPVAGAQRFLRLAAGGTSFCGVDLEHRVWCWGTLGSISESLQELTPVRMAGDLAIGALAFSYYSPCGLVIGESRLVCWWGGNMAGVVAGETAAVTVAGDHPIVDVVGLGEFGVFRWTGGGIGFAGDLFHDMGVNRFVERPSDLPATGDVLPSVSADFTALLSRGSSWWCGAHQDGATLCSYRVRSLVGVPAPL